MPSASTATGLVRLGRQDGPDGVVEDVVVVPVLVEAGAVLGEQGGQARVPELMPGVRLGWQRR